MGRWRLNLYTTTKQYYSATILINPTTSFNYY